jgi:hypothetical protein
MMLPRSNFSEALLVQNLQVHVLQQGVGSHNIGMWQEFFPRFLQSQQEILVFTSVMFGAELRELLDILNSSAQQGAQAAPAVASLPAFKSMF